MDTSDSYLTNELKETLKVINSCLSCVYSGEVHMYRALAAQLRILLCDRRRKKDNSLLVAVYPQLEVSALASIDWSPQSSGYFQIHQTQNFTKRVAQMPFEITQFSNGLAIADLQVSNSQFIAISDWSKQFVTYNPTELTIEEIIRSVADKGGGAHVDSTMSSALRYMRQQTPVGLTYAQLLIIALARFVNFLGGKLFKYNICKVPDELFAQMHHKYNLGIVAHHEWSEARGGTTEPEQTHQATRKLAGTSKLRGN